MGKKLSRLILFAIVALQCGAMFYWASRKADFYNDEYYTFEYAQNLVTKRNPIEYMTYSPMWKDEEWLSVGDLKTRFTLEEGESVLDLPFGKSVKKFFVRRNYMWIVNALETVLGDRLSPKWICIGLNVLILAMFQFLLFFFLAGCLGLDRRASLLAVAMWGFSPYVLGLAVFCRFYALALLLFLIVLVLHRLMWDCDSVIRNLVYEALSALAIFLAYKDSELVVFACGCLILFFTVGLIARKRYVQAVYYAVPFMAGGAAMLLRSSTLINAVIHPRSFIHHAPGTIISAHSRHIKKMLETSFSDKIDAMWKILKGFGDSVPGSTYLLAVWVVLLIVLCVLVWKRLHKAPDGFAMILFGVAVAFWIFCGVYLFSESRYHSMLFLLLTILGWWSFDKLVRSNRLGKVFYGVALCLVTIGAVLPFFRRNVEYVYEDWKHVAASISEYKGSKNLLVTEGRFIIPYSSVNLLDESSSIYALFDVQKRMIKLPDLPPTFLLWVDHGYIPRPAQTALFMKGYGMEPLVTTYLYDVYVCKTWRSHGK